MFWIFSSACKQYKLPFIYQWRPEKSSKWKVYLFCFLSCWKWIYFYIFLCCFIQCEWERNPKNKFYCYGMESIDFPSREKYVCINMCIFLVCLCHSSVNGSFHLTTNERQELFFFWCEIWINMNSCLRYLLLFNFFLSLLLRVCLTTLCTFK